MFLQLFAKSGQNSVFFCQLTAFFGQLTVPKHQCFLVKRPTTGPTTGPMRRPTAGPTRRPATEGPAKGLVAGSGPSLPAPAPMRRPMKGPTEGRQRRDPQRGRSPWSSGASPDAEACGRDKAAGVGRDPNHGAGAGSSTRCGLEDSHANSFLYAAIDSEQNKEIPPRQKIPYQRW